MSTIFADKFKNTSGGNNVKVNQLSGIDTAGSISVQGEGTATTNLQQGLVKHWCTYDGDESSPVEDSFNQASFTDVTTGKYSMSFTNNFSNITHCPICGGGDWKTQGILQGQEPTTSGTGQIQTRYPNTAAALDTERTGHMIAGDLA